MAEQLEPGEATVGTHLHIEHLKATPLGMRVRVAARVVSAEGRHLSFDIEAFDELELVARALRRGPRPTPCRSASEASPVGRQWFERSV
jgi:predicted thioesterase